MEFHILVYIIYIIGSNVCDAKGTLEYNIDITAQNINKYTALQYIFDADVKYIAFGNDHNDIVMLQHASSGYIIGPSEAYTHAILKLDKIKHINNNAQAICKVLKSYK